MDKRIHTIGRHFVVGRLYDGFTDSLAAQTLAEEPAVKSIIESRAVNSFEVKAISRDTFMEKINALGLENESKLEILLSSAGTCAAKRFVNDCCESALQSRAYLYYRYVVKEESFPWKKLQKQWEGKLGVALTGTATHFVSAVTHGLEMFVLFETKTDNDKQARKQSEELQEIVAEIAAQGTNISNSELTRLEKVVKCTVIGSIRVPGSGGSLGEVLDLCSKMDTFLAGHIKEAEEIDVTLTCLSELDSHISTTYHGIQIELVDKLIDRLDDLQRMKAMFKALSFSSTCSTFEYLGDDVKAIQKAIQSQISDYRQNVGKMIVSVRNGTAEPETLSDFLSRQEKGPGSPSLLSSYLSKKKKELMILENCGKILEEIILCQTRADVDSVIHDMTKKHVFGFEINLLALSDPFLIALKTGKLLVGRPALWVEDPELVSTFQTGIQTFVDFALTNRNGKGTGFFVGFLEDPDEPEVLFRTFCYKKAIPITFNIPYIPDEPSASAVSSSSVTLNWSTKGENQDLWTICAYRIVQVQNEAKAWKEVKNSVAGEITVSELAPATLYEFRVCTACSFGNSAWSKTLLVKTDFPCNLPSGQEGFNKSPVQPADVMAAVKGQPESLERYLQYLSNPPITLKDGPLKILGVPFTIMEEDQKARLRKVHIGKKPLRVREEKIILVMGATGAGKSTLINGLFNYFFGVQFEDPIRFRVINEENENTQQASSMTKWITAYTAEKKFDSPSPYSLTVIDTPGFGDTEGIKRDKHIIKQISVLFSSSSSVGIDRIDAVCIVLASSQVRLTATQRYIFDNVLSVFGNDIAENIFLLCTFADNKSPPVLESVRAAKLPYRQYYPFNNCALFEDNKSSELFTSAYWDMGTKSLNNFLLGLQTVESKSLILTREVLKERQRLEASLRGLQIRIQHCLEKVEKLKCIERKLNQHRNEVKANENFVVEITVPYAKKVDLPKGTYISNCIKCSFTCHHPCGIPENSRKASCSAMSKGSCTVCPGKCPWNVHFNHDYRFEWGSRNKKETLKEIKESFEKAMGKKLNAEELFAAVRKELIQATKEVACLVFEMNESLLRLDEIALRPNVMTTPEYIDLLIQSERSEQRDGYLRRIEALREARKQTEIIELCRDKNLALNANGKRSAMKNAYTFAKQLFDDHFSSP